jgi:hypothetical protein
MLFSELLKTSKENENSFFKKKIKNLMEYLEIYHLLKMKLSKLINYSTN